MAKQATSSSSKAVRADERLPCWGLGHHCSQQPLFNAWRTVRCQPGRCMTVLWCKFNKKSSFHPRRDGPKDTTAKATRTRVTVCRLRVETHKPWGSRHCRYISHISSGCQKGLCWKPSPALKSARSLRRLTPLGLSLSFALDLHPRVRHSLAVQLDGRQLLAVSAGPREGRFLRKVSNERKFGDRTPQACQFAKWCNILSAPVRTESLSESIIDLQ